MVLSWLFWAFTTTRFDISILVVIVECWRSGGLIRMFYSSGIVTIEPKFRESTLCFFGLWWCLSALRLAFDMLDLFTLSKLQQMQQFNPDLFYFSGKSRIDLWNRGTVSIPLRKSSLANMKSEFIVVSFIKNFFENSKILWNFLNRFFSGAIIDKVWWSKSDSHFDFKLRSKMRPTKNLEG